jgi:hypothetical protein
MEAERNRFEGSSDESQAPKASQGSHAGLEGGFRSDTIEHKGRPDAVRDVAYLSRGLSAAPDDIIRAMLFGQLQVHFICVDGNHTCGAQVAEELDAEQSKSSDAKDHGRRSRYERWQGRLDCRVGRKSGVSERRGEDWIKITRENCKARFNQNVFAESSVKSNAGTH